MKINELNFLNKIYNIDSRLIIETLPEEIRVQTTITSPPYYDMKDYGSDNQVGYGQDYSTYLEDLKKIFEGVFKITKDDGTLWIIIDTFKRNNQVITLPFDLADKLKQCGWLLQDVIIWKKDKTLPWSSNGFMQKKFEYILLFSKSSKYKSNKDSVRLFDTTQLKQWWIKYPERYNPKGKALDEIWEFPIPIQGSWGDKYIRHFCPLPQEMVATMIQLSSDENDIILDPFAGTGTVLSQSAYLKRSYIGFELNMDYIQMFETYLLNTLSKNQENYKKLTEDKTQMDFENQILDLRALKFARILISKLEQDFHFKNIKIFVEHKNKISYKNKIIEVIYQIIGIEDTLENLIKVQKIVKQPPLSKFGIEPEIQFLIQKDYNLTCNFGYTKTNTYAYQKNTDLTSDKIQVISRIKVDINENDYL